MSNNEAGIKQVKEYVRDRAIAFKAVMDLVVSGIEVGAIGGDDIRTFVTALCKVSTSEGALLCLTGSLAEVKMFGEIQTPLNEMVAEAEKEKDELNELLANLSREILGSEDGGDE